MGPEQGQSSASENVDSADDSKSSESSGEREANQLWEDWSKHELSSSGRQGNQGEQPIQTLGEKGRIQRPSMTSAVVLVECYHHRRCSKWVRLGGQLSIQQLTAWLESQKDYQDATSHLEA